MSANERAKAQYPECNLILIEAWNTTNRRIVTRARQGKTYVYNQLMITRLSAIFWQDKKGEMAHKYNHALHLL